MPSLRPSLILLLLLIPLALAAQPRVAVIQLENRSAASLLDQLQNLYPTDTAVFTADGQRLLVKAEEPVLAEVRTLIERLDVAPAQLRITLRQESGHRATDDGPGSTTISTRQGLSKQSIVVQDGETAQIEAGSIRRVTRAVVGGDTVALIAEDTPMTQGFLVQPRALGPNQIELRIISFNNDQPRHRAMGAPRDTAAVVTVRRVNPGEWVLLGSSTRTRGIHNAQVYSTSSASADNQSWSIKVDVLP